MIKCMPYLRYVKSLLQVRYKLVFLRGRGNRHSKKEAVQRRGEASVVHSPTSLWDFRVQYLSHYAEREAFLPVLFVYGAPLGATDTQFFKAAAFCSQHERFSNASATDQNSILKHSDIQDSIAHSVLDITLCSPLASSARHSLRDTSPSWPLYLGIITIKPLNSCQPQTRPFLCVLIISPRVRQERLSSIILHPCFITRTSSHQQHRTAA